MVKFLEKLANVKTLVRNQKRVIIGIAVFAVLCTAAFTAVTKTVKEITVTDGNETVIVRTMKSDTDSILQLANVTVGSYDKVEVTSGRITVSRAFKVDIIEGTRHHSVMMTAGTVDQALSLVGVVMEDDDIINIDPSALLSTDTSIAIDKIDYNYTVEEQPIAFTVNTVYSDKLDEGKTQTTVQGTEGVLQIKYMSKVVNGEIVSTETVEQNVVKEPVATETVIGTKKPVVKQQTAAKTETSKAAESKTETNTTTAAANLPEGAVKTSADVETYSKLQPASPIALDSRGRPVNYSKIVTGKASAYSRDAGPSTATGQPVQVGYVAVNPKQIPLGSKLYIITPDGSSIYGYAVAEDTGGFARLGRVIDLFMASEAECIRWGVRNVEIYVLK